MWCLSDNPPLTLRRTQRSLRHWLSLLRSRLPDSRPPFLSRSDDRSTASRTQFTFLPGSSLCHALALRLAFLQRRPRPVESP